MTGIDTTRGRVWAVLLGLMGGMVIGLPFRPGVLRHDHCERWHCHHLRAEAAGGCPWLRAHRAQLEAAQGRAELPPCEAAAPTTRTVTIPPSPAVREIHLAPGVGVRLDLGNPARDPFTHPGH